MPNHVHIIAVPRDANALGRAFRHVHRHDTGYVNARMRVTGHLWQGRFSSVAMDEQHLYAAFRYVALTWCGHGWSIRLRIGWSSTQAHCAGEDNHVVRVAPAIERIGDFRAFVCEDFDETSTYAALRKAESIGRPVGSSEWLEDMEARIGRSLMPAKRGPKLKQG